MQLPTNEQLIDMLIVASRGLRPDPEYTDTEMREDLVAGLEEEPAAAVIMARLAKQVYLMGYNAAVASRLPTMTLGVRSMVGPSMVFRYPSMVELQKADQEWKRFIMGEPEQTDEPAK